MLDEFLGGMKLIFKGGGRLGGGRLQTFLVEFRIEWLRLR